MEKRTILAVILSVLVLMFWSSVAPKPPKSPEPASEPQKTLATGAVKAEGPSVVSYEEPAAEEEGVLSVEEKTETISAGKLNIEFSNIGGTIKKVVFNEYGASLPLEQIITLSGFEKKSFTLDEKTPYSLQYSLRDKGLKIIKTYEVSEDDYLLKAKVDIVNVSGSEKAIAPNIQGYVVNMSSLDNKKMTRDRSLYEYSFSTPSGIKRKGNAFKFAAKETKETVGKINWIGFRDRYFCALIKPLFENKGYHSKVINEKKIRLGISAEDATLGPKEAASYNTKILFAPQSVPLLKKYNDTFASIMVFSRFGIVDGISKFIYMILTVMHDWGIPWGFCIILIAFGIYGVTYPLTMRSMVSMRRMQMLQPEMNMLKEKHKNNSQKLNMEMMELYKKHKVNPFGGCLPMFFQMPIFIGLYQVLWRSVFFKGESFLWIKDLSYPDRLIVLKQNFPVIGNELNILPLIMAVTMYFQQKLTSRNMVVTDPNQASQQKMMAVFMPIFLGFIFYKFASGLTLYFTVFYILSCFTQFKISKMAKVSQ